MYFKTLRNLSFGRGCPLNERAERWSSRQTDCRVLYGGLWEYAWRAKSSPRMESEK
jgi:hypothetical protein